MYRDVTLCSVATVVDALLLGTPSAVVLMVGRNAPQPCGGRLMRIRKKVLSVFLSLVIAISLCPPCPSTAWAATGFSTSDVTRLVPKTYSGSGQCQGYAKYIGKKLTGVEPCGGAIDSKRYGNDVKPNPGWAKYTSISAAGGLRVGDFIRIPTRDGYGHAAIITSVGPGSDPVIQVTEKWGSNTTIKNGNLNGNLGIRGN